jgi:endonuclease YncB( thermonuclease family)
MQLLLVMIFTLLLGTSASAAEIIGTARVIDGDTIEVGGKRIRLFGIDAPESKQTCTVSGMAWACGQEATWALAYQLAEHWVTCQQRDIDRYKRIVAVCYIGGSHDVGADMVRNGWALVAYRQYSQDYVAAEIAAQRYEIGIWRGEFVKPWEWRRSRK